MNNLYIWILFFLLITIPAYSQNISSPVVTNLNYIEIPQYELPKRYLIDNNTTLYPKENPFRRADIVFFLSIPVTFFIFQNLINFINIFNMALGNYNSDLQRDNYGFTSGEWNFIIAGLLMIPTGVMIYDSIYVKQYPIIPIFRQEELKESRVSFTVYKVGF